MLYRFSLAALLLLSLSSLVGCPAGSAEIVPSPMMIDFGEVPVGDTVSRTFTIENTGDSETVVSFAVTSDSPFELLLDRSIAAAPNSQRELFVEATPTGVGLSEGTLTIAWASDLAEVALRVTGVQSAEDLDDDGYTSDVDCDDDNPAVNPGATEVCNGVDDDCEGGVDEDFDTDGDDVTTCGDDGIPDTADDDCDDTDATANPDAEEVCDAVDNDCDEEVDEGFDGDGDGYTSCGGDCDDTSGTINPDGVEVCNGLDEDCDGDVDDGFDDIDGDGAAVCTDCDDNDAEVAPGLTEVCDSKDNDCNGTVDDGFPDADSDSFDTCDDCDDADAGTYPGAPQQCDGVLDNDCDAVTDANESDDDSDGSTECDGDCDDADPAANPDDADNDGVSTCDAPADCDDADSGNFPGNTEACDGLDNDCDGVPESSADADGDGVTVCAGDCNDLDAGINPAATEICDGADNNCDGTVDEGFTDADSDGAADCIDCDDNDPTAYPTNTEVCDGIDNDCDTDTDEDFDGDSDTYFDGSDAGCAATYGANADCNDGEQTVYPGAPDVCDAFGDNDCDGTDDPLESDDDSDGSTECDGDCDDNDSSLNNQDADNDGVDTCDATPDCDDNDSTTYPGATELCDGVDNDCLLDIDEDFDGDNDTYFDGADAGCVATYGANADCDDSSDDVYPGAPDICDAFADNDCDGSDDPQESDDDNDGATECDGDCDDTDSGLNLDDADGDGVTTCALDPDCDDSDGDQYPGAPEVCSGPDQDCDGVAPDPCTTCDEVLDADPSRFGADGVYTLDTDGAGALAPFDAWCDLTTDGGGWTLIQRTTDDGVGNATLTTTYADFYGIHFGVASAGVYRAAGEHWEALADNGDANDEIMVLHGIVKDGGLGDCDPIPYILSGSGFTLNVPSVGSANYLYTGEDPQSIVNGFPGTSGAQVSLFSTTDDGPQQSGCITNSLAAVPWFYLSGGNCGESYPAADGGLWSSPQPRVKQSRLVAGDITAACNGDAPSTSASWLDEYMQEYYVR